MDKIKTIKDFEINSECFSLVSDLLTDLQSRYEYCQEERNDYEKQLQEGDTNSYIAQQITRYENKMKAILKVSEYLATYK